jgi:anti-sigma factor RsiW
MNVHARERLSAYLDGELTASDAAEVERHLRDCTECARELAIMRNLGGAMRSMSEQYRGRRGIWQRVHARITRPVGWLLILAGTAVWLWLIVSRWLREELTLEWAAATGVAVGLVLLMIGLGYEQYRDWRETRYKDVQR